MTANHELYTSTKESEKLTSKVVDKITHQTERMNFISKILSIVLGGILILVLYWAFERDPLTIKKAGENEEIFLCIDGYFEFQRYIKVDKPLRVRVEPRLHDLVTDNVYVLEAKIYEGGKQEGIVTYRHKVSASFPYGLYDYEPTLIYDVNPIKTIEKKAPTQTVFLGCSASDEINKEVYGIITNTALTAEDKNYFVKQIVDECRTK